MVSICEKGVVQVVASMASRNSEPVEALTKRGMIWIQNVVWTPQNYTKICQKVLLYWAKSYRAGGGNGPRVIAFLLAMELERANKSGMRWYADLNARHSPSRSKQLPKVRGSGLTIGRNKN